MVWNFPCREGEMDIWGNGVSVNPLRALKRKVRSDQLRIILVR
jgi:hypothetical protein